MKIARKDRVLEPFVNTTGEKIYEMIGRPDALGGTTAHSFGHVVIPPGCSSRPHYHPVAEETYYILSGKARMVVNGEDHWLSPGDAVLIMPPEQHQIFSTGSVDLEFIVVNMGPAAATSPSFARLVDDAGATVSLHLVTSLASMAAGGPYTTTVDRPLGDQASYTLSVDAFDVVSESDETNNSLSFSLGYPLASGLVSEARAELFGSIDPGAGLRFDELLGFIETMGPSALHELMDWALQTGSPGPIDPEGPLGQAWTHTVSLDDGWLMMSVPTTARVHHAVAQQAWAAGIY